jgi:hypothetical protein
VAHDCSSCLVPWVEHEDDPVDQFDLLSEAVFAGDSRKGFADDAAEVIGEDCMTVPSLDKSCRHGQ